MKHDVTQIRDLSIVLKDLEPLVKDPRFLRVGREFANFGLRPREVLANWLLCAIGNYNYNNDNLTFSDDPTGGDGIVINKRTGAHMLTEHVFIPEPKPGNQVVVEDKMVAAIEHKVGKGVAYAQGKHLVIFSEAIGWWTPNRLAKRVAGSHAFNSIWVVGLERGTSDGYTYWIASLHMRNEYAPVWRVSISFEFDNWKIERLQ